MRMTALLGTFLALAAAAHAGDYTAARVKAEAYRAEQSALLDARAQNNMDAIKQHAKNRDELLRDAITLYEQAGAGKDNDPVLIQEYAELLANRGDYDLAADALKRAAARDAANAALWAKVGENLGKVGPQRRQEAFESLRKSLELDKTSPAAAKAFYALGDLCWREGLYEQARENLDAALKLAPEDVPTRIALAAAKARAGQVLEAENDLDAVGKAAQPYDAETRAQLRQALADFDAARRFFADTAENNAAYARLLYRAARIPEAILAAQRATRQDPKDFALLNFIAAMQIQLGNLPQAKKAYERSLEANPDQAEVQQAITQIDAQIQKAQQPPPSPLAPQPNQAPRAPMIMR